VELTEEAKASTCSGKGGGCGKGRRVEVREIKENSVENAENEERKVRV
jgi:hypothetical protein